MSSLDKLRKNVVAKAVDTSPPATTGQASLQERLRQVSPPDQPTLAPVATAPDVGEAKTQKPKKDPKTDRSIPLTVSMPSLDVARIQKIRKRAAKRGDIYPKSQIMRAAIIHFDELDDGVMLGILKRVAKATGEADD